MHFVAWLTIFSALLSLSAAWSSWANVKQGTAGTNTIRDLTGIIRKAEIERLFGTPDEQGYYLVSVRQITSHASLPNRILNDGYFDVACVIICAWGVLSPHQGWVILLAFGYQLLSWGYSIYLVFKNSQEILEE